MLTKKSIKPGCQPKEISLIKVPTTQVHEQKLLRHRFLFVGFMCDPLGSIVNFVNFVNCQFWNGFEKMLKEINDSLNDLEI